MEPGGERVGAALEQPVEFVQLHLEHAAKVDAAPDGLVGGPTVLDSGGELLGSKAEPTVAAPGDSVQLTCDVKALARIRRKYMAFVHFEGPGGRPHINGDPYPAGGFLPTPRWVPAHVVRSTTRLRMPDGPTKMRAYVGLFVGNHRATADLGAPIDTVGRILGPEVNRR